MSSTVAAEDRAVVLVVVDDQHLLAGEVVQSTGAISFSMFGSPGWRRQVEHELGAASDLRVDVNRAAHHLDERSRDGEAQPGPAVFARR